MKIFFSILLNASILFIIYYLLNNETNPDAVIVTPDGIDAWRTYLVGGIVLGFLNSFIKPILKLLGLTLFFIYPIVSFAINGLILWLVFEIINYLDIGGMTYIIDGWTNLFIAIVIFTILNTIYSILFNKK